MDFQRECIDCGTLFTITEEDKKYFKSKGWVLPKRCPNCRKYKRESKKEMEDQEDLLVTFYLNHLFIERND